MLDVLVALCDVRADLAEGVRVQGRRRRLPGDERQGLLFWPRMLQAATAMVNRIRLPVSARMAENGAIKILRGAGDVDIGEALQPRLGDGAGELQHLEGRVVRVSSVSDWLLSGCSKLKANLASIALSTSPALLYI